MSLSWPSPSAILATKFGNISLLHATISSLYSLRLAIDANGNSIKLYHEQIKWQIITRSGALYLRVWDSKNPAIKAFKGFDSYEINTDLILEAAFSYYERSRVESVASKLGVNDVMVFIGQLQFSFKGVPYSLEIGQDGFVMVGDLTSGETTYGGGRYMYLELPEADGTITLDFNYLYNPPLCLFRIYHLFISTKTKSTRF